MLRIAAAVPSRPPRWHQAFLAMLPQIIGHARIAFRHLKPESREDAVQEAIANALVAFVRLVQLKKADLAYPTVLARYAVAQINDGRRVGASLNIKDVLSPYCQVKKNVTVERLYRFDEEENAWQEILVADKHAGPAELAASRIDFPAWLATLKPRDRKIAMKLATGETPGNVAKRFDVSAGRVSQLRRELAESWRAFVGEEPMPEAA